MSRSSRGPATGILRWHPHLTGGPPLAVDRAQSGIGGRPRAVAVQGLLEVLQKPLMQCVVINI